MNRLGSFWKKLIIWLTGYLNIIAFIVGGGYIYLKSEEDEETRCSVKLSLIVVAGFTALDMFYLLIYNLLSLFGAGYETLNTLTLISRFFSLMKIITFVTLFALDGARKLDRAKARLREPEIKVEEKDWE